MAVALNTSKRKFHKILDNITASTSQPNLASTLREKNASAMSLAASEIEPPSKRSRTSLSGSFASEDRPSTSASTPAAPSKLSLAQRAKSIRLVRKSDEHAPKEQRKTPNYAPWSHDLFIERMKTFSDVKLWTPKPDILNEVEWAKRGWVCDGLNKVACKGGCEERVVVKLEPNRKEENEPVNEERESSENDVEAVLIERYVKLIVEGHDEECLWRKSGCKERLSKAFPQDLIKSVTDLQPAPTDTSSAQPPSPTSSPNDLLQKLILFTLYGWHAENRGKYSIATCHLCHARVGLWLYSSETSELDLVESHRIHCPWINAKTQGGGKPIWEQLQERLSLRVRESVVVERRREGTGTEADDERPPSSAADSVQADRKRLSRLRNAMKSFGGKLKK
ncbi:zf-C3HC-domain-containing protein [Saccharata proteae CBS 121410]|uniref:Zf-C3HC-domain-containing protein n=1 Tax=Saccharata proteae CBS 121410 TaxID=1314787 RepID=A0A9P4I557_9PEZI|nr:zf-C3HC-domain-containing protein [Saccharata proteae CBS 121410]